MRPWRASTASQLEIFAVDSRKVEVGVNKFGGACAAADDSEKRGRLVDLVELTADGGAGDEAAPGLADECGAKEGRRIVRRKAKEDVFDELLHQRRRRPLRRRHAADWIAEDRIFRRR
ncbi:hypothetical protein EJB05_13857, partial [Eragrostis curvula]